LESKEAAMPDTTDSFAVLGLERRFDLDPADVERRAAQAGASDARVAAARDELASPVSRGALLLRLMGGAADAPTNALPPGFAERIESGAFDAAAERDRLMNVAGNLFRLLGNADNGVVLRERRRQIRETLNALRALAQR
jgi:hypothetical protein